MSELEKGDILSFRGNIYEIEQVDRIPHEDIIIQYRLNPVEGPPATLKPGDEDGEYVVQEFHKLTDEEITTGVPVTACTVRGPDDYHCERPDGHNGDHWALGGEIEWEQPYEGSHE